MKIIIQLLICFGLLQADEQISTFKIKGMMCKVNCPMKVQESLKDIDGVKQCNVDYNLKTATITYDNEKINSQQIVETISKGTYFKVTDTDKVTSGSFFKWLFRKD